MREMDHTSPSNTLKTPTQNGDTDSASFYISSPAIICSPAARDSFTLDATHIKSGNDSTPRAKFLKAAADDRHALHSCTIEDLARLLEDADSAATNENVLRLAMSLAHNEVREQHARAEEAALEAQASAAQAKYDANCKLLHLQQEHKAVVEALILAQRDAMTLATEDENALRLRILQLEQCIKEESEIKSVLQCRNEYLEMTVEDSVLKLSRLESVELRATSLESAAREAWDRVRHVEAALTSSQSEFDHASSQLFESQTHARRLESALNVAEATIVANQEVSLMEKRNFESIVAQLKSDLSMSRHAVDRARAQTDVMIEQLARAHVEKSSMAEEHAESMSKVLSRTLELGTIMDSQVQDQLRLQKQIADSDGAALVAESRAQAAENDFLTLKKEYDELRASSQHDVAKMSENFTILQQEYAEFEETSTARHLAALKKDTEMTETLESLQNSLKDSLRANVSVSLRVAQLDAQVKETEAINTAFRSALEQYQSMSKVSENENVALVDVRQELKQELEVATFISILGDLSAPPESIQNCDETASGSSSPARAMDSGSVSSQNSALNSPRLSLEDVNNPIAELCSSIASSALKIKMPSALETVGASIITSENPDYNPPQSFADNSTNSSPAIPLTTPMASPEIINQLLQSDIEAQEHTTSASAASSKKLASAIRTRLAESRLLSPSSPVLSPQSFSLQQSYSHSSPRPEPESHEGSMCASSDPSFVQENTGDYGAQPRAVKDESENMLDSAAESPLDSETRRCTLQGSATSANGSKVSWVYQGTVNSRKLPEGKGTRSFSNGEVYEGMWRAGVQHGAGHTLHADGAVYIGEYKNGQKDGKGGCSYPNGSVHHGTYECGVKSGFGTCSWANGNVFSGTYANDRMHGSGVFQWASGHKYTGEFARDKRHGRGALVSENGMRRDGLWNNGVFVSETE